MHNLPKHHNTKSQSIGTNDHYSKSVGCSRWDERVKERSNIETTYKHQQESNFKQNCNEIIYKDSIIQIYTSAREFHDIGKIFECRNKAARLCNQKPNMPCTCENCAMMGIIRDSQKVPFADEFICRSRNKERRRREGQRTEETERDSDRDKRNKTNFQDEEHSHCHDYTKLLHRIKDLEERLQIQEETTVPKWEFKEIISGLLTRLAAYKKQGKLSFSTQCEEHPGSSKNQERGCCSKKTSSITTSKHFWKWGEEILKPGVDIKNKVLLLIEDTLKKIPKGTNKPNECSQIFIADTFNKIPQNAQRVVLETEPPMSIGKNLHCSDTSLRISYVNPRQWKESDSTLKSTVSDENLSKTSNNLKDIYKEKFIRMVHNSSQKERQRVWDAVWNQCVICGHNKYNTATIHFPQRKDEDRHIVELTVTELKNILIGTKTGTM